MSRFLGKTAKALAPYAPGEQPRDKRYIKLNTNESPYPPSPRVQQALADAGAGELRLYPDPEALALREAMSQAYGLPVEDVFAGGGSDEVLGYLFFAFFDRGDKVYFPDISYGFYQVYAQLCGLEAKKIPLRQNFTVAPEDYFGLDGHIVIANPNAPTGIALSPEQIERILLHNPDRLVVIDEAYVDFSENRSVVSLIPRYDNLLVVQTYSKSRGLAGMRIGCGLGNRELTAALERIKFSFNPYNLDRVSLAVGVAAAGDAEHLTGIVEKIKLTRGWTAGKLKGLRFEVLPSEANFLFARHPSIRGDELYRRLKEKGILVRQFSLPRISDFIRITVGTPKDMNTLIDTLGGIVK